MGIIATEPNMTDYEFAFANDRLEIPEYFNFGFDVVDKWAQDRTKMALISVDSTGNQAQYHTFWDLKVLSDKYANVLKSQGIKKGDRIFVMLPRIPEWYVVMLGSFKIGAIPMPATTLLTAKDIEYRITQAEASMAISDFENSDKVNSAAGGCPTLKSFVVVG